MNFSTLKLTGITMLLCCFVSTVSAGKLYKWVDKDGTVKFSQSPPPAGDFKVIEKKMKSSIGNEVSPQGVELEPEADKPDTPEEKFLADKRQKCSAVKQNKKILLSKSGVRGMDGKLLTSKQRKAELQLVKRQIESYCDEI